MKHLNRQVVIGLVGAFIEVKDLGKGRKVATFSVGADRNYKDKKGEWVKETTWFRVQTFNEYLIKEVENKVKAGVPVYIEGLTKTSSFDSNGTEIKYNYIDCKVLNVLNEDTRSKQLIKEEVKSDSKYKAYKDAFKDDADVPF